MNSKNHDKNQAHYWVQKQIIGINFSDRVDLTIILRGLLVIFVTWWHAEGYRATTHSFDFLSMPGRICVWLFFAISGYTIGYAFKKKRYPLDLKGILHFYRNRLIRIYPFFLFISLLVLFAKIFFESTPVHLDLSVLAREFLILQWTHTYELVGAFWALGIEIQFYFFSPLLYWFLHKMNHSPMLLGTIFFFFFAGPLFSVFALDTSPDDRSLAGNMSHFYSGFIFNYIPALKENSMPLHKKTRLFCLLAIVILFSSSWLYHRKPALFWVAGPFLVDAAAMSLLMAHRLLEKKNIPLTWPIIIISLFGAISYGIFGWYGFLGQYPAFFELGFLTVISILFLLSMASYLLIEKPILRLKK